MSCGSTNMHLWWLLMIQYPGLEVAFRSRETVPRSTTSFFIVDTMVSFCCLLHRVAMSLKPDWCRDAKLFTLFVQGETELFFDAVPTVFVGGTSCILKRTRCLEILWNV